MQLILMWAPGMTKLSGPHGEQKIQVTKVIDIFFFMFKI